MSYLDRTYVSAICSAIRRQVDTDQRSNSLLGSLESLRREPGLLDRAWFVRAFRETNESDPYFDPYIAFNAYAVPGSSTVDERFVIKTIAQLEAAVEPVGKYADRVIAHRDRRSAELVYSDIDHALEVMEATVKRVWGLAHPGQQLHSTTPVMDRAFLEIFRAPLIDTTFVPPAPR